MIWKILVEIEDKPTSHICAIHCSLIALFNFMENNSYILYTVVPFIWPL